MPNGRSKKPRMSRDESRMFLPTYVCGHYCCERTIGPVRDHGLKGGLFNSEEAG